MMNRFRIIHIETLGYFAQTRRFGVWKMIDKNKYKYFLRSSRYFGNQQPTETHARLLIKGYISFKKPTVCCEFEK